MNSNKLKKDFPLLATSIEGKTISYLDNASTSQKPQQVVDALMHFYTHSNANIHRGVYPLAEQATMLYEQAREKVARFIGADPEELIFTKGTTESINLVATAWGESHIHKGDEIIITELEHHSNMIPWQQLAKKKGAAVRYVPINHDGTVCMQELPRLINKNTKLIAFSQVSNALGVNVPLDEFVAAARSVGAKVLVDAAQSVAHQKIDVHALNIDFLAFSGHKMLGPTGIGGLFIKKELQESFPPYQFGGGMIYSADYANAQFLPAPQKFEAGTPPIAQAIGLAAAVDYLSTQVNFDALKAHEALLTRTLIDGLKNFSRVRLLGPLEQLSQQGHMVSFTIDGHHAHDVATYLGQHGICVRAGNHCAQPLAKKLGIDASVRVSFYLYNDEADVDRLIDALKKLLM